MSYRAAGVVAGTQARRVVRQVVSNRTKIFLYLVAGVVGLAPMLVFGSWGLSVVGEQLAAGEIDSSTIETVPEVVSGVTAVGLIGLTAMATIRAYTNVADVDQPACLLLSTSLQNAVVGLVGAELLFFALWLAPPALVLSGAFAYGAGSPLPMLTAPAALLLVLAVAVPIGFAVGVCVRHLLTVYEPVAAYRSLIVVVAVVAYFAAVALGWIGEITLLLFRLLSDSPLGWPGYLLLTGVPSVPSQTLPVAGALLGVAVVVPGALFAGIRAAEIHWFADPAQVDDEETVDGGLGERLGDALGSVTVSQPVRTVTVTTFRRTKRAPIRLLYVAYPIVMSLFFVEDLVATGTLPVVGAVALSLYVVWGTGAAFTLNVLGDHGPTMESVLISTVSGRQVVAGTVLSGVLVGLPAAIVVAAVVGFFSTLPPAKTGLLTAGMVLGVVASPLLAAGVGTLFPRFGSVRVWTERRAVVPSKTAFLLYTLGIVLPAAAGATLYVEDAPAVIANLSTLLLSLLPAVEPTVTAGLVTALAWVVLLAGIAGPFLSVAYAVRRFESYRPY